MQKKKGLTNVLLSGLLLILLFGFALAVPSATVREDPEAPYETEDEFGDDEFDFLLAGADD